MDETEVVTPDGGRVRVLSPHGPLTGAETLSDFRELLDEVARGRTERLVIRLDDVPLCDAAALLEMMRVHRALEGRGGALKLVGVDRYLPELLKLTLVLASGLNFPAVSQCMGFYATVDEALDGFEPRRPGGRAIIVRARNVGAYTVVETWGRLVMGQTRDLTTVVDQLLHAGRGRLLFDLSGVPWIDSAGLGALCACRRALEKAGGMCWWTNMPERITALLRITKI